MADKEVSFKINADGSDADQGITAVADRLQDLAKVLDGEVKTSALQAAGQLRALASQEAAIDSFKRLENQAAISAKALQSAKLEATNYAQQVGKNALMTREEADSQVRLQGAVKQAQEAHQQNTTALKAAQAELTRLGISAKNTSAAKERLRTQVDAVRQSVQHLIPVNQAAAAGIGKAAENMDKAGSAADAMNTRMSAAGQAAHRMAAQMMAAFTVREAVQAAQDMEKLHAGLQAVTGDAAKARVEMDFIRRTASQAGVDVVAAGNAYLGLAAATKGTAVEGQATRDVFVAVSTSMARAGKSSAETSNALMALQQMAGKGVVSMEEMRQQLGEALPGAMQAAANGMGLTTQELTKLIESGQVTARDLFPALTKGLNDLYGTAAQGQTLAQEITNIKNAFVEMASYIGEAGGNDALKAWAERAQTAITMLGVGLVDFGKKTGTVIAALVARDFSQLNQAFSDIEAEGRDKLIKAALHNDQLRAAIGAVGDEADKAALAAATQAAAVDKVGAAAADAAPSYARLSADFAEGNKNLVEATLLAEKEVVAIKARGDATVAEAKLKGDEVALRKAVGEAAAAEAQAMADMAMRRQAEVTVLKLELEEKRKSLAASKDTSEERKKELAELEKLIEKKQLEADRSRAQAAESKANARAKGEEVQAAQAAVSAAQASAIAKKAEGDATISLLQTQKSLAGQAEEMARLMGDEETARMYRIKQLEIDIEITKAKAAAMRAEAEGSIAVAEATMVELRAKGELTPVKEAELNASIKVAQAKMKEADAIRQSAGLTQQAINNLREYGNAAGRAGDQSKAATDKMTQGWNGVAGSIGNATQKAAEHAAFQQRMKEKYGRPGEGTPGRNEDGRYSSRGEELGKGVLEVGSGGHQFMNKDNMASDAKGNVIGSVESEAQMNQRVAALFGEGAIGMKEAIDAANIKLQLDEADKRGIANIPGNAEHYANLRKEFARLSALVIASGKSGNGTAVTRPAADAPKSSASGTSSGGGSGISTGSGNGSGGGNQYVTYLTVDGTQRRADFKDAKSQSNVDDFLRQAVDAQRRAA